jgi:hypothetical protein
MAERDPFELDLAAALRAYLEEAPTEVRPTELARHFATAYPHGTTTFGPWRFAAIPRLAWVLLLGAALLVALVGGTLLVGSQQRKLPAVVPNLGPVPTCPPGSTPDEPGPVDQARPVGSKNMAFDRRAGRLVVVVEGGTELVETWTFDVCTNTWSRMHPNREPPGPAWKPLVYDIDSDLTLESAYGPDGAPPVKVWVYDLGADTWTEKVAPTDLTLRAYDPLSGLVLATKDGTGQPERWTYDVETDTWTLIDQANGPAWHAPLAYDASVDRIVAYSRPETWLFDIRTGTWSSSGSETPVVEPNWAVPTITYDESAERTVVTGSAGMAAYDAAADRWEVLARPGELYPNPTVYDPVNGRLVGFGWEGDVVAFDLVTREWTVLLEPSEGQPSLP